MLGSVLSSLFAGLLSDLFGRRTIMALSGLFFVASIPIIALAEGYRPMMCGPVAPGRQRRTDRRGRAALPGRVPAGEQPRQRDGHLPVAADARVRRRRFIGLYNAYLRRAGRAGRGRIAEATMPPTQILAAKDRCLAHHLLDVAAAGHPLHASARS